MTEKEIVDYLTNKPMKKYERLNYSFIRVHMLIDFINVINTNASQLKFPANKKAVETGKILPGGLLYEYVIQEISSFYTLIYQYKKEGINLPEIPEDWKKLSDFRNTIPGHLDKEKKLTTRTAWMDEYAEMQQMIPKVIADFEKYYRECVKILGEEI